MISSILKEAHFKVGTFTSPHLFSWQERIMVNGRMISRKDFAQLADLVKPHVLSINKECKFGKLTTFEVLTAIAFCHFREAGTHFQVLETGMGGRLDATNIIENPEVCIITSISLDHVQVLGTSVSLIAAEKAGIIKPGCTVISAPQPPEVIAVLEDKCSRIAAPLILSGRDITWQAGTSNLSAQSFRIKSPHAIYDVEIPLLGDYQMENASLAIAASEVLQDRGFKIKHTQIVRGLSGVKWPARFQILGTTPTVIADGAHNSYSVKRVIESIRRHLDYKKVLVIFGSSADKDIEDMLKALKGFADRVILASSSHPRAAKVDYLVSVLRKEEMDYIVGKDACKSLAIALEEAGPNDLVLGIGSLFLAAEVCKCFRERHSIEYKKTHNPN